MLDSRSPLGHAAPHGRVPGTWRHRGPGEVIIIPSLRDSPCQRNCSERGAVCVVVDPQMNVRECVCANSGLILDFRNAHCSQGELEELKEKNWRAKRGAMHIYFYLNLFSNVCDLQMARYRLRLVVSKRASVYIAGCMNAICTHRARSVSFSPIQSFSQTPDWSVYIRWGGDRGRPGPFHIREGGREERERKRELFMSYSPTAFVCCLALPCLPPSSVSSGIPPSDRSA